MNEASHNPELTTCLRVLGVDPGQVSADTTRARCGNGRRYIIVPSGERPRWILPVGDTRVLRGGLLSYRPWRWSGKLGRACMLVVTASPGLCARIFSGFTVESGGESAWAEQFCASYGERDVMLAFSLGTPGPRRRTTIRIMDGVGTLRGYAKVGISAPATETLKREADALRRLNTQTKLRGRVPSLVWEGEIDSVTGICLTPGPEEVAGVELGSEHMRFLSMLSLDVQGPVGENAEYRNVIAAVRNATASMPGGAPDCVRQALNAIEREANDHVVTSVIAHGDFAPWNIRRMGQDLYVFDWESAEHLSLPLLDVLHFILQVSLLVERRSPEQAALDVLSALRRPDVLEYCRQMKVSDRATQLLCLLGLMKRCAVHVADVTITGAPLDEHPGFQETIRVLEALLPHLVAPDSARRA